MTEYDLAQRERIREMLLAYVKEHKIGMPRWQSASPKPYTETRTSR